MRILFHFIPNNILFISLLSIVWSGNSSAIAESYSNLRYNEILQKALLILRNTLPWIPLWHPRSHYLVSKQITGFTPPPMYSAGKFDNVSLSREEVP